jgi:aquaporin Z
MPIGRESNSRIFHEPTDDEVAWIRDFHDPAYEFRRLFAEALGTFFLVLAILGSVAAGGTGHLSVPAQSIAPGLVIMAVIYTMGSVSGAHLNPAVTFSYALRRNFPWRRVPGYWLAQLIGAIVAAECLGFLLGSNRLGAPLPARGVPVLHAFFVEAILTLGMVTVTLGTSSGQNGVGPNAAIARAGYIIAAGLWAGSLTGASMNPARSVASALVSHHWSFLWLYIFGPLCGGIVAVGFAWILRGPPTLEADVAAQGSLAPDTSTSS